MSPRFVLFDLGGVLCDVDIDRGRRRCLELGYSEAVFHAVEASGAKRGGDAGALDEAGMLATVRTFAPAAAARLTEAHLGDFWGAIVTWRRFVPTLLERLTVPFGVLSVIDPFHAATLGPLPGADPLLYSYEAGVLKPDPRAFQGAIAACPQPAEAIRFLDDRSDNVQAARIAGLDAVQVSDLTGIQAALTPILRR